MLKLVRKNKELGCNDYEKKCEKCGEQILIHVFPGIKKEDADRIYKTCRQCN